MALQCCSATSHRGAAAITLEHVYLSECGTRLTLRGIPWTESLEEADVPAYASVSGPAALRARSRALLQSFACMLRELLGPADPLTLHRTVGRSCAEAGIALVVGEKLTFQLDASEREAAAAARVAGGLVWLPPIVEDATGRQHEGGGISASHRRAVEVSAVSPSSVAFSPLGGAERDTSPSQLTQVPAQSKACYAIKALKVGSASLCCRLEHQSGNGQDLRSESRQMATVLVPITVYPAGVSPTLDAILCAAAPLPSQSAAAEALRLLEAALTGDVGSPSSLALESALSAFAAILNPQAAESAADVAHQRSEDSSPTSKSNEVMLLHDCVAVIAEGAHLSRCSDVISSTDHVTGMNEVTLESLLLHPYFGLGVDDERWLRDVSDDYTQYSYALQHSDHIDAHI